MSSFSNFRLDSGYIDSDGDLGINSSPGRKFLYRSIVHCAPLKTKGYTKKTRYTPPEKDPAKSFVNRTVFQYFYGEGQNYDGHFTDFTYQYAEDPLIGPAVHNGIENSASSDYTLALVLYRFSRVAQLTYHAIFTGHSGLPQMSTGRRGEMRALCFRYLLCRPTQPTLLFCFYQQMVFFLTGKATILGMPHT